MCAYYRGTNAGLCSVSGCITQARYKGMCGKHYKRQWRHGDPKTSLIDMEPKTDKCSNGDCNNTIYTRQSGLCKICLQRLTRYCRVDNIMNPRGEYRKDTNGYMVMVVGDQLFYQHRVLAEMALGRPLPPKAVVHHMNGDKTDNFTSFNLVICPDQEYHLLLHRRAKELGYNFATGG